MPRPHRFSSVSTSLFLAILWMASASSALAQVPTLTAVELTGLVHVREDAARGAIKLKPGDPCPLDRIEMERKALLALGYFRSVGASQRLDGGRTTVTFRVVEWPRVAHIRVLGNSVVERRAVQDVISTRVGQVLCSPQLLDDIRAIEGLYRDRGYVAQVSDSLLDEAITSGILRFEILEVRIDEVIVEGVSSSLRKKARAALSELPPALYEPVAVSVDRQRLLEVKGIREAVPRVDPVAPGKVRIRWTLNPPQESPSGPLR